MSRGKPRNRGLFAGWKAVAQSHAIELGLPDDLWTKDDNYEIAEAAGNAFDGGVDPKVFIEDIFAEDLDRMQNDEDDFERSLEEEEE